MMINHALIALARPGVTPPAPVPARGGHRPTRARWRRGSVRVRPLLAASLLGITALTLPAAAAPLGSFTIDPARVSVSGLSSGAYMAGQFHVAFSDQLIGAGIVAGGPYDCAGNSLSVALNRCMNTGQGAPDPAQLLQRANALASGGRIAPLDGLAGDRVYVFSGTEDATVTPPVVATVPEFYRLAGLPLDAVEFVDDTPAGHAFVTETATNACGVTAPPFVNDCDHDQAGALLTHIHGQAATPPPAAPGGQLIEFDQTEFLPDPTAHGMANSGWVYVPPQCAAGEACGVHVVFHGCKQTAALVGDAVTRGVGYNRWADALDLIVLYPQADDTLLNPNACWDWWGYDDAAYATRTGRQMAAVDQMLDRLADVEDGVDDDQNSACQVFDASNFVHWQAGRARICDIWFLCAVGSGDPLGFGLSTAKLFESPPGNFSTTPCGA